MIRIEAWTLPCSEEQLRAAVKEYVDACEAHKTTVGVPAPWPKYDCVFEILRLGGEFEVIQPPAPTLAPEPTEREKALAAMHAKLAADAKIAEDRMLAQLALQPDAPLEVKAYVDAHPEVAALLAPTVEPMLVVDTTKL